MKVSYNWLSDYVAHGLAPDALADALTMSGLEVDGVEATGQAFDGVVVGHVRAVRPHPDADRLRVTEVDLGPASGDGAPVQIVCGAPNVAEGQKVPVATVGTTLLLPSRKDPAQLEPVEIKKSKIRGEVSLGMICAEDELGIGTSHDGILVLDADAPVGQPFADYLAARGRSDRDWTLDVAVTPNRPDATSHIGVARDVAALTGAPLQRPEVAVPAAGGAAAEQVSVTIEDADLCRRFAAMIVRGVRVGPSPEWLRRRLEAAGLRSISNVVDVTNYVMLETGQPLHGYDLDRLAGPALFVRQAAGGEAFTTLDEKKRELPAGTLMVADADGFVGVAGVMGGMTSEVSDATINVLLEGAWWHPATIRKTAKALGLATDAAYRFERGVDPEGQPYAVARAAQLLVEVAGGEVVPGLIDAHPNPMPERSLDVRLGRLRALLGADVEAAEAVRLLRAIGFAVEETGSLDALAERALQGGGLEPAVAEGVLRVTVPGFRPDVEREVDVIEEVARLWGYDRVPAPANTSVPLTPPPAEPERRLRRHMRDTLAALGFQELYTNSLLPAATAERFCQPELTGVDVEAVVTANAISREMAALRPTLLPGLLTAAAYNQNRGARALRLFEWGHVFGRVPEAAKAQTVIPGYFERAGLVLGMSGPAAVAGWDTPARAVDFYDAKGAALHLLRALGIEAVEEVADGTATDLTQYRLFLEAQGRRLGVVARVADALVDAFELQDPVFFAELDWAAVAAVAPTDTVRYQPFSRAPWVDRDIAVTVERGTAVGPLLQTIRRQGGRLLRHVRVFDLYQGERIEAGQKSVAFGLTFGADRTLTDAEIDKQVRRIVGALEREHGAALRR